MIDCPICHVMNEDMARFCAECGQRLSRPGPAAPASPGQPGPAPAKPEPPKAPESRGAKLNSPLLGSDASEAPGLAKPDISRLRGAPQPGSGQSSTGGQAGSGGHLGLRSPLLGGVDPGAHDEPMSPAGSGGHLGLRSPLLGGVDPGQNRDPEPPAPAGGKKPHLHSPLLGGDDDIYEDTPPARPQGRGGKLKSPLLSGDDSDYPASARGSGGLRSPLLGGSDSDAGSGYDSGFNRPASGKPHLRSPLLGGEDEDLDEPPRPPVRGGGLRSPILGSAETVPLRGGSPFVEPDDEDESDQHVLRSPLLGSKVPVHDKSPQGPAVKPSLPDNRPPSRLADAGRGEDSQSSLASSIPAWGPPDQGGLGSGQSGFGSGQGGFGDPSYQSPSGGPQASPPGGLSDYNLGAPSNYAFGAPEGSKFDTPGSPAFGGPSGGPPARPGREAPQAVPPNQVGDGTFPDSPGPQDRARSPGADKPDMPPRPAFGAPPDAPPAPNAPQPGGSSSLLGASLSPRFDEPIIHTPASGLSGLGQAAQTPPEPQQSPPVNISGLRGMSASAGAQQPQPPEEPADLPGRKRRFKMLEETEPETHEPPQRPGSKPERFASPQPQHREMPAAGGAALPGFVKLLVLPLGFAAVMKVMTTIEFMKANYAFIPTIADQIGQILVCVCLIIICLSAGNTRN